MLLYKLGQGTQPLTYEANESTHVKAPEQSLTQLRPSGQVITSVGSCKVTPIRLTGPHHLYLGAH